MAPIVPVVLPWIMTAVGAASTGMSIIGGLKGRPKAPQVSQDKSTENRESLEAAYAQAQWMRKRGGFSSTILTGPMGASGTPELVKATLG